MIREKNIETPSFPLEKIVMSTRISLIHTRKFKPHVPFKNPGSMMVTATNEYTPLVLMNLMPESRPSPAS
jgi:hypothetical protein